MGAPSRRPLLCLALVGTVAGIVLVIGVPVFEGPEERYHFARAWAISDFDLVPDDDDPVGDRPGAAACLPDDVAERVFGDDLSSARRYRIRCEEVGVDVATWGSVPALAYVGPVLGIAATRFVGAGVGAQLWVARLASLAVYLAMAAVAVSWAPRARWALVAVALVPSSLYEAAVSCSAHGFTIGASLLVVGSALRLADPAVAVGGRRRAVEASLVCLALAAAEPPFVVLVACYLIVRQRRAAVLVPALVATVLSGTWHWALRGVHRDDVRTRGVAPDPGEQLSELASPPWTMVSRTVEAFGDHGRSWLRGVALVDVVPWATLTAVVVVAAFAGLGVVPDRVEESRRSELSPGQRAVLVGTGLAALLAVVGWELMSASEPGRGLVEPFEAWMFGPVAAPLLAGLTVPGRGRWRPQLPWPLLALAAFYVAWLSALIDTVR